MNNIFLTAIAVLLVLSGVLYFFYNRDVLSNRDVGVFEGCVPINLQIQEVSSDSFTVEWGTSEKCLGLVKYGDSIDSIEYFAINEEKRVATKEHFVTVKNLKPSSIYYVVVFSEGVEYGLDGAPIIVNTKAF